MLKLINTGLEAIIYRNVPDYRIYLEISRENPRSAGWDKVRDEMVKAHPFCAICGNKKNLIVHHILPYHKFPNLELVKENLIVLCEGPVVNCHFLYGHIRNWKSWNPDVVKLAAAWEKAIKDAKKAGGVIVSAA